MDRVVVCYLAVSLDGMIADSGGGVAWMEGEEKSYRGDYGYSAFLDTVDTIVMGRNTYHQLVTKLVPDKWVYEERLTYVMTHHAMEEREGVSARDGSVRDLIRELKAKEGKHIWICGGADVINQCIREDVIDLYRVLPVILGTGVPLFRSDLPSRLLHLKQINRENGAAELIYERRIL
ncbi:MAG: dihydrofolate reductase family protein [Anaerofustis sp.]